MLEKQVGLVLREFGQVTRTIEKLLNPASFALYRANATAVNNRAVFEIPNILNEILKKAPR